MASAIARPAFSFQLRASHSQSSATRAAKSHFVLCSLHPKLPLISSSPHGSPSRLQFFTVASSVDVSKEDKPSSEEPNSTPPPAESPTTAEQEVLDKRRLEERFAVLNTGIYECRSCGYRYDEALGDPSYPIAPGLQFEKLPEDWRCPTCGAAKSFFQSKSVEIAGFAQNQQFGLGTNSLTSAQKLVLIYGSLFFFFALFLGGYFLQ